MLGNKKKRRRAPLHMGLILKPCWLMAPNPKQRDVCASSMPKVKWISHDSQFFLRTDAAILLGLNAFIFAKVAT